MVERLIDGYAIDARGLQPSEVQEAVRSEIVKMLTQERDYFTEQKRLGLVTKRKVLFHIPNIEVECNVTSDGVPRDLIGMPLCYGAANYTVRD